MEFLNRYIGPVKILHLLVFLALAFFSLFGALVVSKLGVDIGALYLAFVIGVPVGILILVNKRFGYFLILILSFIMAWIVHITYGAVPVIILEVLMLLVFLGVLIKQIANRTESGFSIDYLKNPITIALLIWTIYIHLQFFNPNSYSLEGKFIAIRFAWYNLIGYVISMLIFTSMKNVRLFFNIVLWISFAAALYGISQVYIGLLPYDHDFLFSSPERMSLFIIFGKIRSWSFMNDPANFGILMAFSSVVAILMMLGPYSAKRKMLLGVMGVTMLVALVGSGTRTAYVMVPVGFAIFGMLTINNFRTIAFSCFILLVFLTIYFGPFYSAPILRVRTAFQGTEDASMNVRVENKSRIQPYILSHPIGGGLGTTGEVGKVLNPGHELSGFPPDSGYLKIALETGFIGFLLLLWLYYKTASISIAALFKVRDKEVKTLYIVILASFMALCTGNLTQLATTSRPFDFFIFAYFALVIRLQHFDKEPIPEESTEI